MAPGLRHPTISPSAVCLDTCFLSFFIRLHGRRVHVALTQSELLAVLWNPLNGSLAVCGRCKASYPLCLSCKTHLQVVQVLQLRVHPVLKPAAPYLLHCTEHGFYQMVSALCSQLVPVDYGSMPGITPDSVVGSTVQAEALGDADSPVICE